MRRFMLPAKFITFSQQEKLSFSFYQRSSIASYSSAATARAPMSVPCVCPSVRLSHSGIISKRHDFFSIDEPERVVSCYSASRSAATLLPVSSCTSAVATSPISWSSDTARRWPPCWACAVSTSGRNDVTVNLNECDGTVTLLHCMITVRLTVRNCTLCACFVQFIQDAQKTGYIYSVPANVPPERGTNRLKNGTSRRKRDGWQPTAHN